MKTKVERGARAGERPLLSPLSLIISTFRGKPDES
jgi:hypothetical protein